MSNGKNLLKNFDLMRSYCGKNKQFFLASSVLFLVLISVGFASIAPIYPDEIAFKIFLERYFISGGFKQSVAAFCQEEFLTKPGLSLIPAAMFWSIINLLGTGWVSYRIIPWVGIAIIYFCLIFHNIKNNNKTFWPLLLLVTMGTTLYGLILLRAEILILSIGMLIYTLGNAALKLQRIRSLYLCAFLVLALFDLICYVHPKSIYMIVLVFAVIGVMSTNIKQKLNRALYILTFASLSLWIIYDAVALHNKQFLSCKVTPLVQNQMIRQAANPIDLIKNRPVFIEDIKLALSPHQLASGFKRMVFSENYQIGYLPSKYYINNFDKLSNILIYITVAGFALYSMAKLINCAVFLRGRQERKTLYLIAAFGASIFIPLVFNTTRAFYEISFLVCLLMIAATLLWPLKATNGGRCEKYVSAVMPAYMVMVSALCVTMAYFNFVDPFWKGYEGPSISIRAERSALEEQIKQSLLNAEISESEPIVADDLTYEIVKNHPAVIPVTYLMMVQNVPGGMKAALKNQNAHYGVVRCPLFDGLQRNLAVKIISRANYTKYDICVFKVM